VGVKGAVERDTHIRHYIPISFVGPLSFRSRNTNVALPRFGDGTMDSDESEV